LTRLALLFAVVPLLAGMAAALFRYALGPFYGPCYGSFPAGGSLGLVIQPTSVRSRPTATMTAKTRRTSGTLIDVAARSYRGSRHEHPPLILRVLPNSEMMTAATLDRHWRRAMISKPANKSDPPVNHKARSLVKTSVASAPCPTRSAMIPGTATGRAQAWGRAWDSGVPGTAAVSSCRLDMFQISSIGRRLRLGEG
jgi:hypothetical protein